MWATLCSTSAPSQWDQYLGNAGRTAYIHCSGPDSPEILWEILLEGEVTTPFILGDKVIVFSHTYCTFPSPPEAAPRENIAVIDLLTGTLLQKIVPEEGLNYAYPLKEDVVIGESGEGFYEIDLASEEISLVSDIHTASACLSECYPAILPDRIIFPTTPVLCLSREDYHILWNMESSLGSSYPEGGEVRTVAASAERVYIVVWSEENTLYALDSSNGTLAWKKALTIWEISCDESYLFVGGDTVCALDAETGDVLWTFESRDLESNIMVGPDTLFFTTSDNYLYALDKKSGTVKWKTSWKEEPIGVTYIVGARSMIICENAFNTTSFRASDGAELWNVHSMDYLDDFGDVECPAVAEGIIVVGDKFLFGGQLTALVSDPELFVKQGDAFLCQGLKEKAGDSYRKAVTLYEKKGNLGRAGEIKKKISELGFSLETQPLPPSASPSSSVQPSPEPPPLTKKSALLIASIIAIVVFIIIITYYFVKRKQNKQNKRS